MSTLRDKIQSRGYWRVVIRPGTFAEARISDISALYPMLQKRSVELRGWDFPHVDPHTNCHMDKDWIGQESEWEHYLELWRFYQSGQFVDIAGMPEDWRDQSRLWPASGDWKPGTELGIGDTLFRFTEIFEFAARLALTEAGDYLMHIEVAISGIKGRKLWVDTPRHWPMHRKYAASIEMLPYQIDVPQTQLIAEPRELALKPAIELFRRFDWDPSVEMLREMQAELWR